MNKTEEVQAEIDRAAAHFADDPDEAPARVIAAHIYETIENTCDRVPDLDLQIDLEHLIRDALRKARKTGPTSKQLREETWQAAVQACVEAVGKLPFNTSACHLLNAISDVGNAMPKEGDS